VKVRRSTYPSAIVFTISKIVDYYEFVTFQRSEDRPTRSPNLRLLAGIGREHVVHPKLQFDAECPYTIVACGYNFDPPKQVFREYLAAIDQLVIWRYVVAGSFLWDDGKSQFRLGPGSVLITRQPAPTRLVISSEGVCVLWLLFMGRPALDYCEHIVSRFGRSHVLPPTSVPVKRAEELVRIVRRKTARSPFFWSDSGYLWLSACHHYLEKHRPPLSRMSQNPERVVRLLPALPKTVKSFAVQLGYSPSHFSRQIAKKWKETPGRLLRSLRFKHARRMLVHGSERIQTVAAKAGYASVPAFITAFKKAYGCTPLVYRHTHR
jgi:AraC-like DNA-binding protein